MYAFWVPIDDYLACLCTYQYVPSPSLLITLQIYEKVDELIT